MPQAERVIGIYGMGLTQHLKGVENVQMLVNLLLLRGNIGRPGPASARCAATPTSRANVLSASPRSPSSSRSIRLARSSASSRRATRA